MHRFQLFCARIPETVYIIFTLLTFIATCTLYSVCSVERPFAYWKHATTLRSNNLDKLPEQHIWDVRALPPKHQGNCGSCSHFAAAGTVEMYYWLFNGTKLSLSEQEILDCGQGSGTCEDGWYIKDSLDYIKRYGIGREQDTPYVASVGSTCIRHVRSEVDVTQIVEIPGDGEHLLQEALYRHGPLAVSIASENQLISYKGGIYDSSTCSDSEENHSAILVGYGIEHNVEYWLLRSSWGQGWGENGYFRLKKGHKICNIGHKDAYYIEIASFQSNEIFI